MADSGDRQQKDLALAYRDYSGSVQRGTLWSLLVAAVLYTTLSFVGWSVGSGEPRVIVTMTMSFESAAALLGMILTIVLSINVASIVTVEESDHRNVAQIEMVNVVMTFAGVLAGIVSISALMRGLTTLEIDLRAIVLTALGIGLVALTVETAERVPPRLVEKLSRAMAEARLADLISIDRRWAPRVDLPRSLELKRLILGWGRVVGFAALVPLLLVAATLVSLDVAGPMEILMVLCLCGPMTAAICAWAGYGIMNAWAVRNTSTRIVAALAGLVGASMVGLILLTLIGVAGADGPRIALFTTPVLATALLVIGAIRREAPSSLGLLPRHGVASWCPNPHPGLLRSGLRSLEQLLPRAPLRETMQRERHREMHRLETASSHRNGGARPSERTTELHGSVPSQSALRRQAPWERLRGAGRDR